MQSFREFVREHKETFEELLRIGKINDPKDIELLAAFGLRIEG